MFVFDIEPEFFEPFFPPVRFVVRLQIELTPFFAFVFDIDVAIVLVTLGFAPEVFERLCDFVGFIGIVDMLGFPLRALVANDLGGVDCRGHADHQCGGEQDSMHFSWTSAGNDGNKHEARRRHSSGTAATRQRHGDPRARL